jgi:hypothetical protein
MCPNDTGVITPDRPATNINFKVANHSNSDLSMSITAGIGISLSTKNVP